MGQQSDTLNLNLWGDKLTGLMGYMWKATQTYANVMLHNKVENDV
jgi:hypothetical protein